MEELPNLERLTDGEKNTLIQLLWEQNKLLRQKVGELEVRIKDLEDRLAKNSQNSSKPPSSDGYNKPNPKSRREKGKRKPGGQKGHIGTNLKRVKNPDQITDHTATDCGFITAGIFPIEAYQAVQYGSRIKSLMVYMSQYQLLPYARLKEFFIDLFQQSISEGTLVNVNLEMHSKLEKTEETIKNLLKQSGSLHVDETGCYIDKKRQWLHVASTQQLTYYDVHPKRGAEAFNIIDILPHFKGTLIHDHLKSYFNYGKNHALCNAHHLRELTFIQEQYKCKWAKDMEDFLLKIKKRVETYYEETGKCLSVKELKLHYRRYKKIVSLGRIECPRAEKIIATKRSYVKESKARNMLNNVSII